MEVLSKKSFSNTSLVKRGSVVLCKEGMVVIAKYLEEADGGSFLAQLKGFFIHHLDRLIRAGVQRCIVQATQNRSALVTRGNLMFLLECSVVRILGTNKKG